MSTCRPRLSVILATESYGTIRPVIARLRDQAVRSELELILVAPAARPLQLDSAALSGFAGVRCVEVDHLMPLGPARAAGVLAATAPVVVIGETHSFPHPGWAKALIEAHAEPWAVVVPAFDNANPESPFSWAAFLRDYGLWVDGLPPREIDFVPPYNMAVKRDVLLGFGDRLEQLVSRGDELTAELHARGYRACFHPAARIAHANVSRPLSWLAQRFLVGRVTGAVRAKNWSRLRRLLYACGSPLIPAVILGRIAGPVRLVRRTRRLPAGTVPALVLGTVASAVGELISYVVGGDSRLELRSDEYELYKLKYTSLPAP